MRPTSRLFALAFGFLVATTFPGLSSPVVAQTPLTSLKLTVRYTGGAGQVDQSHRICIWLWDNPSFLTGTPDGMPIALQMLGRNGDVATFMNIASPRVWVSVVYDHAGGYQCNGPPPSGSPATTYVENDQPAPIATSATATVTISFDDSFRIPTSFR